MSYVLNVMKNNHDRRLLINKGKICFKIKKKLP